MGLGQQRNGRASALGERAVAHCAAIVDRRRAAYRKRVAEVMKRRLDEINEMKSKPKGKK